MAKTGLILEGGAMRGMFTAGILDVMMENNISFDGMVGVSAGAAFGCNMKSHQIGRTIRYNLKYAGDKRYCSLESLIRTGDLYNAEFCYHTIPETLDPFDWDTYLKNPMEFYIVATDVKTGKPVYHRAGTSKTRHDELEWFRASASMPTVARPVLVDGYELLDGGISNSIPLQFFEHIGYEHNVVVLTQPDGFRKKLPKAWALMKQALRKYPAIIKAMEERPAMYNEQLDYIHEAEHAGRAFVIRPEKSLGISRTEKNPEELKRVYEEGRSVMLKRLPELREFLSIR
ncbi:MAG: patatin family protein [Oribacterium sp.]|nr:patatin family protein [Oribacterium sp.]